MYAQARFLVGHVLLIIVSGLCLLGSCSGSGISGGPTAGGKSSALNLGGDGAITTIAGQTVSRSCLVQVFQQAPKDQPPLAILTLRPSDIVIAGPNLEIIKRSQTTAVNGSARIAFYVAPASATDTQREFDDTLLGEYNLSVINNEVSIAQSAQEVPPPALDALMNNTVRVTTEITANFDANVQINQVNVNFGHSASSLPPSDTEKMTPEEQEAEIDQFFESIPSTPTPPPSSPMKGCWEIKFVPLRTSDGSPVPDEPNFAVYEINDLGGLNRVWNQSSDLQNGSSLHEFYRFGLLQNDPAFIEQTTENEDGAMSGKVRRIETNVNFNQENEELSMTWALEREARVEPTFGEAYTIERADMISLDGDTFNNPLGEPDAFMVTYKTVQQTVTISSNGTRNVRFRKIVGVARGFLVVCPDQSDRNVYSQEEQVIEGDDSTDVEPDDGYLLSDLAGCWEIELIGPGQQLDGQKIIIQIDAHGILARRWRYAWCNGATRWAEELRFSTPNTAAFEASYASYEQDIRSDPLTGHYTINTQINGYGTSPDYSQEGPGGVYPSCTIVTDKTFSYSETFSDVGFETPEHDRIVGNASVIMSMPDGNTTTIEFNGYMTGTKVSCPPPNSITQEEQMDQCCGFR